jgi:predicted acyl esterase
MRQPYGREIASTVVYAHPTWYAARGYQVVIQDVRGRGTSAGTFSLFAHEAEDGYDTVQWAAQLPHSNGRVGMYGFSYQGMTQLYAAQTRPPALQALAPMMVGYHPYSDWAYENGALVLQAGLGWALQLGAETARLRGDRAAYAALAAAAQQGVSGEPSPARCPALEHHDPTSFWADWLAHPQPDDYWDRLTPDLQTMDLPMFHGGGWFDPYLRGDLRLYHEMAARSRYPQWLWVGPWGHIPWGRYLGDRDFGPQAHSPIDRLQVRWFNHWLKDEDTGLMAEPPVHLFDMGHNRWQAFSCWPQAPSQRWQLHSQGNVSLDPQAGQLISDTGMALPPEESNPLLTSPPATAPQDSGPLAIERTPEVRVDYWVHDPWRPVPSLGGHCGIPAGPYQRSRLDDRSDVLTFTSGPLADDLTLGGNLQATLQCQADAPSFDLSVVLSVVEPEGAVSPFTQGYRRFDLPAHQFHRCTVPLQATCITLMAGQALRLSLSAACFPAYALNPGTGATAAASDRFDAKIITLALATGPDAASYLSRSSVQ